MYGSNKTKLTPKEKEARKRYLLEYAERKRAEGWDRWKK